MVQLTNVDIWQHVGQHKKGIRNGKGVCLINAFEDMAMACSKVTRMKMSNDSPTES